MDVVDEEILNFWKILHEEGVKYLMVGGFATTLHGFARTTADMDIWLKDTKENRKKLIKALKLAGVGDFPQLENTQLIPGWTTLHLPTGFELDIMTTLKGLSQDDFNECYEIAPTATVEDIPVKFLHINHLIKAKEASNRPKDKLDVAELKKIRDQNR